MCNVVCIGEGKDLVLCVSDGQVNCGFDGELMMLVGRRGPVP